MIAGLRDVAALPDPVGEISQMSVRPSGLRVGRMRIPLGVIAIVYESRPNVTVDAAALCVKSGNAVILRGGSEAIRSNLALGEELRAAATETGVPADAIAVVPTTDRAAVDHLLTLDRFVDLLIPRGGTFADPQGGRELAHPGREARRGRLSHLPRRVGRSRRWRVRSCATRRSARWPSATASRRCSCTRTPRDSTLPFVLGALAEEGVEIRGCSRTPEVFPQAKPATEEDWGAEYLAPILAVRVVDDLDAAIAHIQQLRFEPHRGDHHQ